MTGDDGTIGHAELDVGDGSVIFLSTPSPHYENPKHHREHCTAAATWSDNPWVIDGLMVEVDDVDAHHARAATAGATVLREPEDVEGHRWMFVHPLQR